jgi:DNA-binding NtrC family response regulator
VVERLVILCSEARVGRARLGESLAVLGGGASVPRTAEELNAARQDLRDRAVEDLEKSFLLQALGRSNYNVTKAAAETGMQRTNFQALLKKHGLRIKDLIARGD